MRKITLLFFAVVLTIGAYAQFNVASDNAGNYTSWNNGSNEGFGFGAWNLWQSNTSGWFLGSSSEKGFGNIDINGKSFGLWGNPSGDNYANAQRLVSNWGDGATFSIDIAVAFRNGSKGITLFATSWNEVVSFNISGDQYKFNGTNLGWAYDQASVFKLSVTQQGSDLNVRLSRGTDVHTATIVDKTLYAFKLYNGSTDAGNDLNNLYFNNLKVSYSDWSKVPEGVKVEVESNATLNSNKSVSDLIINSGTQVELAAGKQLTITGAATNAGTIILKTGATIIGDIAGTATVEQAAEEKRTYYIGSPVSGTGVGSANIGDYITFTESTDTWSAAAAFSGLAPDFGKGYGVQVAAGGTHGTPATISFTGTLNNSPAAQTVGMTIGKNQFNFLGNPYPSYLSSATVLAGGDVEQSLWFYTRTATTPEVKYQFITYNPASGGTVIPETEGIDGNVAPMQGFWVKANTASNFTFSNAMRSHKVGSAAFRAPQASEKQVLRLQVSNGTLSDEAVMLFSENANSDWNSSKMMNEGLNIYTVKAA
ncbi:MAG TPA: hypothetical protein GXZ87_00360, partial [Bacteroidales bacterium]|nr:hypothetical protein [Bacteroidales bacterium]